MEEIFFLETDFLAVAAFDLLGVDGFLATVFLVLNVFATLALEDFFATRFTETAFFLATDFLAAGLEATAFFAVDFLAGCLLLMLNPFGNHRLWSI